MVINWRRVGVGRSAVREENIGPRLLVGRQRLHLVGQDSRFLQDGKLRLGSAISTKKSRADEREAPGKSQQSAASVKPEVFIPESSARFRRRTQR
ncbi:hypothetical protein EYF80_044851 [Liparis tanakae]|uniref:Uncharacterized protein n=1 Tax=Liparis tanakae TaxID=230148 RepID=A0A4Z2FUV8_9TELE|nr:hypothetical protein EYF80_044851 [Liparis tanakae]